MLIAMMMGKREKYCVCLVCFTNGADLASSLRILMFCFRKLHESAANRKDDCWGFFGSYSLDERPDD